MLAASAVARHWLRLGCIGFGGPPAHLQLLRQLCVLDHEWLTEDEFSHAVAATSILPGPASTQTAIYCAWFVGGPLGAVVGGLAFILPGLLLIIAFAAVLLSSAPPLWLLGAAGGAGAVVPAIALGTGRSLLEPMLSERRSSGAGTWRLMSYLTAGGLATIFLGSWLVLVLLASGLIELLLQSKPRGPLSPFTGIGLIGVVAGLPALVVTGLKVGLLSFGGGFVIVPLMRADALHHGWLTSSQFLDAVALGQLTPGPVVQTIAVVGYGAHGLGGALLASAVAFAPSFLFVLIGGRAFTHLRSNPTALSFLRGAGPAALGAILGSSVLFAQGITEVWQWLILGIATGWILVARKTPVLLLLAAAFAGGIGVGLGWLPH